MCLKQHKETAIFTHYLELKHSYLFLSQISQINFIKLIPNSGLWVSVAISIFKKWNRIEQNRKYDITLYVLKINFYSWSFSFNNVYIYVPCCNVTFFSVGQSEFIKCLKPLYWKAAYEVILNGNRWTLFTVITVGVNHLVLLHINLMCKKRDHRLYSLTNLSSC